MERIIFWIYDNKESIWDLGLINDLEQDKWKSPIFLLLAEWYFSKKWFNDPTNTRVAVTANSNDANDAINDTNNQSNFKPTFSCCGSDFNNASDSSTLNAFRIDWKKSRFLIEVQEKFFEITFACVLATKDTFVGLS